MILKGSQRAGGMQLANHLLNEVDNDHVTLHEVRGFVADDLHGAMKEAYAISRGTQRCRQFLFSLSLNPPERANVSIEAFEEAIAKVEDRLSLAGLPRAIVFHEKEGRRHCHAVWLRVDTQNMRAINLPYFKFKLRGQSRELFIKHGWKLPKGLRNKNDKDPLNYSLPEQQQAKRINKDPKVMKSLIQDSWNRSDNLKSFQAALEQNGLLLAKGDRRGHVAVDWDGNVYAVSRWAGVRAKAVREKLGQPETLPTVEQAKKLLAQKVGSAFQHRINEHALELEKAEEDYTKRLRDMRQKQREDRRALANTHESQRVVETRRHVAQLPTGLKAIWFRLTGQYGKIKYQIEQAAEQQKRAQEKEREAVIRLQLLERQALQHERRLERHQQELKLAQIRHDFLRPDRDGPTRTPQVRVRSRSR